MDKYALSSELRFQLENFQGLSLDASTTPDAFMAWVDRNPIFRPCRATTNAAIPVLKRADIVTITAPAGPSPSFVGRTDIIQEIEMAFRNGDFVVNLCGMGGIGKSEICRYLFYRYAFGEGTNLARQIGWVIWKGTLKDTFYAQFKDIREDSVDAYWRLTQNYLCTTGRDILIFLDNANTLTERDAATLAGLGCRFLMTSRIRPERLRSIPVGTLSLDQCRILYRRVMYDNGQLTDDSPDETLDAIFNLSGGHTLTVILLAKTQRAAQLSAPELLERLQESGFDLTGVEEEINHIHHPELDDDSGGDGQFIDHMARVFDLSSVLRDSPKNAATLRALQGMSLLAPNTPEPMRKVKKWLDLPNFDGLNRASKAGWLNAEADLDGTRRVSIHPVVAAVVHRQAPPHAELVDAVAERLYQDMIVGDETEVFIQRLPVAKHAAALDRVAQSMGLRTANYGKMLGQMGYLLWYQAEYDRSLSYQLRGVKIEEETLGTNHPDTAETFNNIGLVYEAQGDYSRALEWYQKALDVKEKVLGLDHPDTAATYRNVGTNYFEQGRYAEALQWQDKAQEIFLRVLGPDHPLTKSTKEWITLVKQRLSSGA